MVSEFPISLYFFFLPLEKEHSVTKEEKLWETY